MRPTIEYHCQYSHKSRKKDVTITRLQLGRCGLNHYLHVMKRHPDGCCESCKTKEDIEHYIVYCKGQPAKELREWQQRNGKYLTMEEMRNATRPRMSGHHFQIRQPTETVNGNKKANKLTEYIRTYCG